MDQYFGTKELYEVSLRANTPMTFGKRHVDIGEPVLYFDKVKIATLTEQSAPKIARGGWGNRPWVVWEDRSDVTFTLSEGVMTSIGMGLLTSARMLDAGTSDVLKIPKKEKALEMSPDNKITLQYIPSADKPIFCYSFERDVIQEKKQIQRPTTSKTASNKERRTLTVIDGKLNENYLVDYYIDYGEEALVYLIEQERFNGTFSLEGKFYTKDENDGINTTNIMIMPKVRVVSNINLRLGERADPTTSVFSIIAMPEHTQESEKTVMKIIRLDQDIDGDF